MILFEKHGYLDQKTLKLDEITDTIYDIIHGPEDEWEKTYRVFKDGKTYSARTDDGIEYREFIVNINSNKIKKLQFIIVKLDEDNIDYDTLNKITKRRLDTFLYSDALGFYSINMSTDELGIIFISANAHVNTSKSELKNTIYHEIRHYFDDLVKVIPNKRHGTVSDTTHYIEVLGSEILDVDFRYKGEESKAKEPNPELQFFFYITDPTELNAFYHSLVIDLQDLKKDNQELTYKDIKEYLAKVDTENNMAFIYEMYHTIFDSEEKYKKCMKKLLGNKLKPYIQYFSYTFPYIKMSEDQVVKQNRFIMQKYLHNKSPYMDDITKDEAKYAIKHYIEDYYMKFVYKQIIPYIKSSVKNIDKLIVDLTLNDE